jgi:predicted transcriptional regulator
MTERIEADNPFGEWLQTTLDEKRLSVGEFYQRALISRAAVYHYLSGRRVPDQSVLTRIASALGVDENELPPVTLKKVGRPARNSYIS